MRRALFAFLVACCCSVAVSRRTSSLQQPEIPDLTDALTARVIQKKRWPTLERSIGATKSKRGIWTKRTLPKKEIVDCMTVASEPGEYLYRSSGGTEACGLYMVTDPDKLVVAEIDILDVACSDGLVVFFDGWELNGKVFPSDADHGLPLESRITEMCSEESKGRKLRFVSSQNAALIQYRVPTPGQGFAVKFTVYDNAEPCNILMSDMAGVFTLRNHGLARNCSLTTLLFPANFELMEMKVGGPVVKRNKALRHGISASCDGPVMTGDFLELGGSEDLESTELETRETLCGYETAPAKMGLTVLCGSSTMRLVSSGTYKNSVTVFVKAADNDSLDGNRNMIMACPDFA